MLSTRVSRRDVYRNLAQHDYSEWPAYSSTPLYDRSSLCGLNEDIRTVASTWFDHEAHNSVEAFAVHYLLEYSTSALTTAIQSPLSIRWLSCSGRFFSKHSTDGTTRQLSSNTSSNVRRLVNGLISRRCPTSRRCGERGTNGLLLNFGR